jgi:hypothetical protein
VVIPSVISEAKAAEYVDRMYKWLEGFGKGFKGDDRSTWKVENMPVFAKSVLNPWPFSTPTRETDAGF